MKRRTPSWRMGAAAPFALVAAITIAACGGSTAARSSTTASANIALEFSHCMRAHGVPDFPDPTGKAQVSVIATSPHAKANGRFLSESPEQVQIGMNKCQKYSPDSQFGPIYTAAQLAQVRAGGLVYARCMRAHGIDYPDPVVARGPGGHGYEAGVPRNSPPLPYTTPAYKAANSSCPWPLPADIKKG